MTSALKREGERGDKTPAINADFTCGQPLIS